MTVIRTTEYDELPQDTKDMWVSQAKGLVEGLYYCGRPWDDWRYEATSEEAMSENDFLEAELDRPTVNKIAAALYKASRGGLGR